MQSAEFKVGKLDKAIVKNSDPPPGHSSLLQRRDGLFFSASEKQK